MRVSRIDDPADARVADYRGVRDPTWLKGRGLFIVESRQLIAMLLAVPDFGVRSLLLTEPALESLRPALDAGHADVDVYVATSDALRAIGGHRFHQGALAAARLPDPLPPDALWTPAGPSGRSLLIALDEVTNPDNVGSAFRNALAFGAAGVLLSPGCAHPFYRKSLRTSMGAALRLPFAIAVDWPKALDGLGAAGYARVALEPGAGSVDIADVAGELRAHPRVALLAGHEHRGLRPETLERADRRVRIAMTAEVDSVNVATATGIALHRLSGL